MIEAYACYNKNRNVRMNSSSGGIYPLLAERCLINGGVVFAAIYDSNWNVVHSRIEKIEDIKKSQGSKYVASHLGDTFYQVKEALLSGEDVIFVGTPCQGQGLKSFLRDSRVDVKKLLIIDFICHGVPSRLVWRKYLSTKMKNSHITNINMRDKSSGWTYGNYSWAIEYENKETIYIPRREVSFMTGMVDSIYLRDSCYECKFKGISRESDITLGDYWHVWEHIPEMDDNCGTSLVVLQSIKGKEWFDAIKDNIIYIKADSNKAASVNQSMIISEERHPNSNYFFKNIDIINFDDLVFNASHLSISQKILRKITRYLNNTITNSGNQRRPDIEEYPVLVRKSELCCGCTACYSICAKHAITMEEDDKGFEYPKVDLTMCTKCNRCIKVCPIKKKTDNNARND